MASTGETTSYLASRWAHPDARRAVRIGGLVGAWIGATLTATLTVVFFIQAGQVGVDAHAYWLAGRLEHPYGPAPGELDAFLYSPVFAQLMRPLALLPWTAFCGLWMVAETGTFYWLLRPLPMAWRIPVLLLATTEIVMGNVYAFFAAVAVLGLRYPTLWAFPLLTKIVSAVPGFVWFAVRGEWRKVAKVAAVSSALVAVSFALDPTLWVEWVRFLLAHGGQPGWAWLRLVGVVAVVAFAARRDWAWVLPFGLLMSAPAWARQVKDMSVLLGTPRLVRIHQTLVGGSPRCVTTGAGSQRRPTSPRWSRVEWPSRPTSPRWWRPSQ